MSWLGLISMNFAMLASGMAFAGDPDSSELARKWASPPTRPVYTRVETEASAKTIATDASVSRRRRGR